MIGKIVRTYGDVGRKVSFTISQPRQAIKCELAGAKAGAAAVVNDYKSIGSAVKTAGGAITGGVAGRQLAQKATQEVAEKTLSRAATQAAAKAGTKVVAKGILAGSGVGTLVSLLGDVATYTAAGHPVVMKCQQTYSSLANSGASGGGSSGSRMPVTGDMREG